MIVIAYGKDITKNTYDALAASDIGDYLKPDFKAAIKPNLVVARPADGGATTHPEVAEGIILFLRDFGLKNIKIIESSWVGDNTKRAYKNCGYETLASKYKIPLVDLKSDKSTTLSHGKYNIEVCKEALDTDFLINVPVLKAHCQTDLTCCMKNLKGCIPDNEKRKFHSMGLHGPIAALAALLKTGYNVIDGICGDLSFEEGGNPVEGNRIIVGRDPLLLDSYCAELIGYQPDEIGYIKYAKEWGIGECYSPGTKIVELNVDNKPLADTKSSRTASRYKNLIEQDSACSACYSGLIYALHRMGGRVGSGKKIYIGQGFKGKSGDGIGIGVCAKGFSTNVPGCPPKATDIIDALK